MAFASPTIPSHTAASPDVSLLSLYLLRAAYLLLVVGLGLTVWPSFAHHASWTFWQGIGKSMLAAIQLTAIVGLRYPLKILPLLFFEMTWKIVWLIAIPLPLWLNHVPIDANVAATVQECAWAIIFPFLIPWRYVMTTFVAHPADRWH